MSGDTREARQTASLGRPGAQASPSFRRFASAYGERGITCTPLRRDADGIAKEPIDDVYPRFRVSDNQSHDWEAADGIGILLGKASGNLAVIDVDDNGLAEYMLRRLSDRDHPPLMDLTARQRLHVYATEPRPSRQLDLEVRYSGRGCLVQLLATGCVAAAPPTPGYQWVDPLAQPLYGEVAQVWRSIALDLNLPYREARPWSFLRRERSRPPTTAQLREALR